MHVGRVIVVAGTLIFRDAFPVQIDQAFRAFARLNAVLAFARVGRIVANILTRQRTHVRTGRVQLAERALDR